MLKAGSFDWRPDLAPTARALVKELDGVDPEALDAALDGEVRRRLYALMGGILAYRRHPYRRQLADPPTVWEEGRMRLLDYGAVAGAAADGVPVLVVPSLINRAYILDLSERRSFLRYLAAQGLRPLLLDWDRPGPSESGFTLTDYVAGRMEAALNAVLSLSGRRPLLIGYCMGGLLALALAARRQEDLGALVLLATPWDFHAERSDQARIAAFALGPLGPLIDRLGELPVDMLQVMFTALDPMGVARKFCTFGALAESAAARAAPNTRLEDFVALEDWLNDGVPLVGPVARECLAGWYGENTPARGLWRIAGEPVLPSQVRLPALVVVPAHDRIVPPASAEALVAALPRGRRMVPPLGHIGMIVGSRAESRLWRPLARWLRAAGAREAAAKPTARAPA